MQSGQVLAPSACCGGHYELYIEVRGGRGGGEEEGSRGRGHRGMNSNEAACSLGAAQAGSLKGNRFCRPAFTPASNLLKLQWMRCAGCAFAARGPFKVTESLTRPRVQTLQHKSPKRLFASSSLGPACSTGSRPTLPKCHATCLAC